MTNLTGRVNNRSEFNIISVILIIFFLLWGGIGNNVDNKFLCYISMNKRKDLTNIFQRFYFILFFDRKYGSYFRLTRSRDSPGSIGG